MSEVIGSADWAERKLVELRDEFLEYGIEALLVFHISDRLSSQVTRQMIYGDPTVCLGLCEQAKHWLLNGSDE